MLQSHYAEWLDYTLSTVVETLEIQTLYNIQMCFPTGFFLRKVPMYLKMAWMSVSLQLPSTYEEAVEPDHEGELL